MALTAEFTASVRVGDGFLSVIFVDDSVGTIVSRKWIFGDGTVIEGNETAVLHTYREPGTYDVILVIQDATDQHSEVKEGYIVVNAVYPEPDFSIISSFSLVLGRYWKLYLDATLHLVFEREDILYRSVDPVIGLKEWAFIEYHPDSFTAYVGTASQFRSEREMAPQFTPSPAAIVSDLTEVVANSTMKIDELKIWTKDVDLKAYYLSLVGQAGFLDQT